MLKPQWWLKRLQELCTLYNCPIRVFGYQRSVIICRYLSTLRTFHAWNHILVKISVIITRPLFCVPTMFTFINSPEIPSHLIFYLFNFHDISFWLFMHPPQVSISACFTVGSAPSRLAMLDRTGQAQASFTIDGCMIFKLADMVSQACSGNAVFLAESIPLRIPYLRQSIASIRKKE